MTAATCSYDVVTILISPTAAMDSFPSQFGTKGGDLLGAVNFDSAGNLYSTASGGGKSNLGTVFRLSPLNGGSQAALSFNGSNGAGPAAGVLIDPRNGTLYGTTTGANVSLGNVYRIRGKSLTVLHSCSGPDGAVPMSGLEADHRGNLYGTTEFGWGRKHGSRVPSQTVMEYLLTYEARLLGS